jgi:Protein of unknown function (DUF3089)
MTRQYRPSPSAPVVATADCFYVYPTMSTEPSDNADLRVQSAEVSAAIAQAARFSQVCRVWAPTYRQVTLAGLVRALGADAGGATWLQVSDLFVAGRPVVSETLGAEWGYHIDDINLALGNLVDDVAAEEAAYTSQH